VGPWRHAPQVATLLLALLNSVSAVTRGAPLDSSDRFYDPQVVQTIQIEIKPEDLYPPRRVTVPSETR
jgi:hypothetical protein